MIFKNRHINKPAAAFLLFYTFFLVFASFHNHIIQSQTTAQVRQTESTRSEFDPFMDENSVCQLSIYSNTKILIDNIPDLGIHFTQISETIRTDYTNYYSTHYFFNFDLRAPPSIS